MPRWTTLLKEEGRVSIQVFKTLSTLCESTLVTCHSAFTFWRLLAITLICSDCVNLVGFFFVNYYLDLFLKNELSSYILLEGYVLFRLSVALLVVQVLLLAFFSSGIVAL